MRTIGEAKARMLLRQLRRKVRREGGDVSAISAVLASDDGVSIFAEELFPRVAGIGDGTILERLKDIFEYMIEHQDEIMQLVELIMKIISLF